MTAPLTPPDCDLKDFAYMPLDVARLRQSELTSDETPEACWAAVLLWCASWHEVPAGSIPDNDQWQAKQAGYVARGKIDKAWDSVRAGALRGFVLCDDGRLYHPVVAEKARESWESKQRHAYGKMCERLRKLNKQRAENSLQALPTPTFEQWISTGKVDPVPPERPPSADGIPPEKHIPSAGIPPEKPLKGEGEGSKGNTEAKASGGKPPSEQSKTELWRSAVSLLNGQGMPEAQARSFVGKLAKDYPDGDTVLDAVRSAVAEQPADARAYLKATCQRLAGERKRNGSADWTGAAI